MPTQSKGAAVLGFFRKAMPFITTGLSLTGPPGNLAAGILGKVLGIANPTQDAVTQALSNANITPELQAQLAEAELTYKQQVQAMGFQEAEELAATAEADRASAREMQVQTRSWMPALFGTLAVGMLGFCVYVVVFKAVPPSGHDALLVLLGSVTVIVKDVYGWLFGSSASSDRKTELLAQGNGNGDGSGAH